MDVKFFYHRINTLTKAKTCIYCSENNSMNFENPSETNGQHILNCLLTSQIMIKNKNINFGTKNSFMDEKCSHVKLGAVKFKGYSNIFSLNGYSFDDITDMCKKIPVFEKLTGEELIFTTNNFAAILLQIGCPNQCCHCGCDSQSNIKNMKWDNFTELVDGIAELKDKLKINLFRSKPDIFNQYCSVNPFHDSDPMIYRSRGSDGEIHNIYDACKYYFDKTGNKFMITTAGWYDEISQNAAEKLAADSTCIDGFSISIHPFHGFLEKSREYRDRYEQSHHPEDLSESIRWKEKYINMMCNVIKSTIQIHKRNIADKEHKSYRGQNAYYQIFLQYLPKTENKLPKNRKFKDYNEKASQALLDEIFNKLKKEGITDLDSIYVIPIKCISMGRSVDNFQPKKSIAKAAVEKEINVEAVELGPKYIYPDGRIMSNIATKNAGALRYDPVELPFKLNFKNPVEIKDKRPIPKLEKSDLPFLYNPTSDK